MEINTTAEHKGRLGRRIVAGLAGGIILGGAAGGLQLALWMLGTSAATQTAAARSLPSHVQVAYEPARWNEDFASGARNKAAANRPIEHSQASVSDGSR